MGKNIEEKHREMLVEDPVKTSRSKKYFAWFPPFWSETPPRLERIETDGIEK